MRSHRRRAPLQHVLIAGSIDELLEIETLLAVLPSDVYGQVIIESPADLPALATPHRMTVHRVDDLTTAVDLWLEEWIPEEPDARRMVGVWVGAAARPALQHLGLAGVL